MSTRPIHAGFDRFARLIEAESRGTSTPFPFQRDQIAAALERQRHRDALQHELTILDRQIAQAEQERVRLSAIREHVAAQLARASA